MARIDARFIVKIDFAELPENEEKLLVFGNETLLLSAINNIVLNACKYSDDRTAMVQLKPIRNDWVVSIRDRGHGIAVDDLDKIFQPFYRGEVNRTTRGFGLGLSLAGKIIKIHKGIIEVESDPSSGSLFTIRLPAAQSLRSN
jgi:signal transduction histidine kinase